MIRTRKALIFLPVYFAAAAYAQQSSTGTAGTVVTEDGKALAGIQVVASVALPQPAVTLPGGPTATGAALAKATSGADGAFQFNGLPPGKIVFCLQAPPPGLLDPCSWAGPPVSVTLAAGQKLTGVQLKVKKGSVLQVRLDDPGQKLAALPVSGPLSGFVPDVLMGVFTAQRLFYPAGLASTDATGRNHQITVPFDTPLKFTIASKQLQLTDEAGAALGARGLTIPFVHPSAGAPPKGLTFHVTGNVKP